MSKIFSYAVTALSMMAITPAFADDIQKVPSTQIYVHKTYEYKQADRSDNIYLPNLGRVGEMAISHDDKTTLAKYLNNNYKTNCAWEHDYYAKKCVAPRAPKKRSYIIGYTLPSDVSYADIPAKVSADLQPLPVGYKYVVMGNDVLLINADSTEVIDAVSLSSARMWRIAE